MSPDLSTLIALETSTELASVTLLHRGQRFTRESPGAQTHSATVPGMIQSVLKEAGIRLSDCAAIAFGAGPGSFTGVRTACGLAQGLAFGANLPVIPVITLLAMAERALAAGENNVLSVLDARMGEVYWAQYQFDGQWNTITAPALSPASQLTASGSPAACGNGLIAYQKDLSYLEVTRTLPEVMPHATDILALAQRALKAGKAVPAREAQPFYLRNKVALTTRERMAGAAA
jgi:tRNA threonylcarbamoyladenosine biosynthesis protein TsaB